MRNDRFEWDDEKARANLARHRVSFESATTVFDDPNAVIEADDDVEEARWRTIGVSSNGLLFVVWTERFHNVIRIISARRATRHEQDRYYRQTLP
jgi:uncharacterized DUF497 family protein